MRTPVQTRSTSSSDRMLDATLELLAVGGLQAVTVAAVARRAETSNGSLYHRFGGRAGLLRAAQDRALTAIEQETAASFARADAEPDDARALRHLARSALEIFARHRGAMRAFLVEGQGDAALEARNERSSHLLATTVTRWLRDRFDASRPDAEAAWRLLFALGASQALFDDARVSPGSISGADFADAVARAVGAVVAGSR
ncbi:TetR/AcrR family transcriptional regulator [Nocardioides sp. URHA0020]|uniref:TetR/AcrR family transcriptional regulator n=1 Tax=Nocardioides sp. URHA0020 TaxID=1380392 RepID=UPI0018CC083F|nr:TetR/AcrR family transcriptional regulator [Nocardioides sp. URHA0020]